MKTSNILASILFGSLAAAVPLKKRALYTKTELVVETVVVYTTVYGDVPAPTAVARPTQNNGEFYPRPSSAAPVVSSQPPAVPKPSSVYVPPPPSTRAAPSSVYTPPAPPVPSSKAPVPAPVPTSVYTPPSPPSSAPAVPPSASAPPTTPGGGETFTDGEISVHTEYDGKTPAGCGEPVDGSTEFTVALSRAMYGPSKFNNGQPANGFCGKNVKITYKGNTITAKVMDICEGCKLHGLDLSLAAWNKLTNNMYPDRQAASWSWA